MYLVHMFNDKCQAILGHLYMEFIVISYHIYIYRYVQSICLVSTKRILDQMIENLLIYNAIYSTAG